MNKFILIGILLLITSTLFIGVKYNDFSESSFFTKSTPSLKFINVPETQNSELTLEKLTQQLKENSENNKSSFLPYLLIQLTLSFLFLGIYRVRFKSKFEKWLFPLHYIVNFFITTFLLGGILVSNNIFATIGLSILILAVNYFSIYKIKNQKIFNSTPSANPIKETIKENNN